MNAVGIDVSKGKSMVSPAANGWSGIAATGSLHTEIGLEQMAYTILALRGRNSRHYGKPKAFQMGDLHCLLTILLAS